MQQMMSSDRMGEYLNILGLIISDVVIGTLYCVKIVHFCEKLTIFARCKCTQYVQIILEYDVECFFAERCCGGRESHCAR